MSTRPFASLMIGLVAFAAGLDVRATEPEPSARMPGELVGVGIVDRPGAPVPQDVRLVDEQGEAITMGELLSDERPVVLVLAYYTCPMLCSLVLNGLNDGLHQLAWTAGDQFRVVTVSIDPRDTPEIARGKQETYLEAYGRRVEPGAWRFLTGEEAEVRRLADAVGFSYRWDEPTEQYVHAAGAFVLTPDGRVSRTLYGIEFKERDLRLAVTEASGGKVGGALEKILMFCFHYDPAEKSYVLAATRLMQAGGMLTMLLLGLWVGWYWRRERAQAALAQES